MPDPPRRWRLVGPAALLPPLAPLVTVHAAQRPVEVVEAADGSPPALATDGDTLVVEPPAAPRRSDAPAARPAAGTVGWIAGGPAELAAYAARAVAGQARQGEAGVVLLGPREARYRALLDRAGPATAAGGRVVAVRWSAERIRQAAMLAALRGGHAAVLHVGHGDARGWQSYRGIDDAVLAGSGPWAPDEAMALLLSLSCATGARGGLAERAVAGGIALAALAPVREVTHVANAALALRLAAALGAGAATAGALVRRARVPRRYRLFGDPATPIAGAPGSLARARAVFAPPPDAPPEALRPAQGGEVPAERCGAGRSIAPLVPEHGRKIAARERALRA